MNAPQFARPRRVRTAFFGALALFVVIPNLLLFSLARAIGLLRPLCVLEYLAIGLIAPFMPVPITGAMLLGAAVLDALSVLVHVYGFTFTELPGMYGNLLLLDPEFLLSRSFAVLAIGAAAVAPSYLLWRRVRPLLEGPSRRLWLATMLSACLAVRIADVAIGPRGPQLDVRGTPQRVDVASSLAGVLLRAALSAPGSRAAPNRLSIDELGAVRAALLPGDARVVVLVLVESLGLPHDATFYADLVAPLRAAAREAGFRLTEDTLSVRGHTTEAEFRLLCDRRMDFPQLTRAIGATCLPERFARAGWRVRSFHAFTGKFFGREVWYPLVGLRDAQFREQLQPLGLPECGRAFRGPCDTAMAAVVGAAIAESVPSGRDRQLIYWLTLSTHLPVETMSPSPHQCDGTPMLTVSEGVCSHARELATTMGAIARLVRSAPSTTTRFVIVGDHPPPFVLRGERHLWTEARVPAFVLEPTTGDEAAGSRVDRRR